MAEVILHVSHALPVSLIIDRRRSHVFSWLRESRHRAVQSPALSGLAQRCRLVSWSTNARIDGNRPGYSTKSFHLKILIENTLWCRSSVAEEIFEHPDLQDRHRSQCKKIPCVTSIRRLRISPPPKSDISLKLCPFHVDFERFILD